MSAKTERLTRAQLTWVETEDYAECRTMTRHRWRRVGRYALDGREVCAEHRCTACGTRRHAWYDIWTGAPTSAPTYHYPEHYLIQLDEGQRKPTQREMRGEYLRHVLRIGRRRHA